MTTEWIVRGFSTTAKSDVEIELFDPEGKMSIPSNDLTEEQKKQRNEAYRTRLQNIFMVWSPMFDVSEKERNKEGNLLGQAANDVQFLLERLKDENFDFNELFTPSE